MTASTSSHPDEAAIRAVLADIASALHAKDADRLQAHYAPDLVQFSLAPPLQSKRLDRKALAEWLDSWSGPIESGTSELIITVAGDAAFAHGLSRMRGVKTDGVNIDLWFRQTFCFRRTAGAWNIVHEHESVPFYMDGSLRAAVDLKP